MEGGAAPAWTSQPSSQHGGMRLSEHQGPEQSTDYALIFEDILKVDMTFQPTFLLLRFTVYMEPWVWVD